MAPPDRRSPLARPAYAALAVLSAALLYGACAGPRPADSAPASIEQIAAAIGCTAEVSVQAEELSQGGCGSGPDAYRMATFAADRGLREWLAEAQDYGGTYLVGNRWVVTAPSEEALTTLRGRLGGHLETGADHGGHPAGPPAQQPAPPASGPPVPDVSADPAASGPGDGSPGPHSGPHTGH
ncbi:hypothetical protein [Streptomyces sp. cmx-4-9]|uniref:hypothetical protein n=1 Tax=Streptomyces sp. cmx-4-9 TaxID=2790941 RepID=UPI00397EFD38